MKAEDFSKQLEPYKLMLKKDIELLIRKLEPKYSERSVYWLLHKLEEIGKLQNIGKNSYYVLGEKSPKPDYNFSHSDIMNEVVRKIETEYPLVEFQVWELIQMNEFVNHQIAKNALFIEVENMLEESIFNMLSNTYHRILLCPTSEIFYTYVDENVIVIQKLLTETPKPLPGTKSCCIEKLLVDLFSKKLTGQLIQRAEYIAVYENAFDRYKIGERKLFRYARRRNLEEEIRDFITKKTKIRLLTEN